MPRPAVRLARVLRVAAGPSADVDLVGRYLQGDPAALEAMVRRHGPAVLGVCRRMLGSGADADDAFQATFLTLTLRARSICKPAALGAWLHGVAVRCCRKALGRRARPPAGDVAGRSDPFAEVAWRELRGLLDEELNRLPATLRAPLILCLVESRARDEAARSLGWSLRTFDRRLARGRAVLKARLVRRGVGALGLGLGVLNAEGLTAGVPERLVGAVCGARPVVPPAVRALVAPAATGFRFKLALGVVLVLGSLAAVSGFGGAPPAEKAPDRPAPKVEPAEDLEDPMPVGALRRFGSTRFRYPSSFAQVALSPDGKRVAIGGGEQILVYDTETGKRLRVLDNFWPTDGAGRLPAMAFSPDGKLLAHLTRYGEITARVMDVETGKEVATVTGLRPDLRYLQYTGYSPPPLHPPEGVDGNFAGLYFTDGGRRIVLVGERYVHVRDARTGAPVAKYALPTSQSGAGGAIRQETIVCFSPDGRLYAVVAGDNWQVREPAMSNVLFRATVKPPASKNGRPAGLFAAISPDGKTLAISTGALDEVQLWDITGSRLTRTLTGRATKFKMVGHLSFSADGKQVFAGGEDVVYRWDAATGTELPALAGDTGRGPPRAFASGDGQTLVTVDGNGLIRRWEPTTGKPLPVPLGYTTQTITNLSADGAYAVVADDAGRIDLWSVGENSRHELNPIGKSSARDVRFSRDGKLLAAGLSDGTVRVWDVRTRKEIKTFRADPNGEPSAVRGVEWSADGSCLYTTTRPGGLLAWDWREGRLRWQFPAADAARIRLSRDGKRLAVIRSDVWEVLILDGGTGKVQTTLDKNRQLQVECVAFSPDGRTVVTGLHGGTVYIWDAATGKYLGWLPSQGQGDVIWGIEFSRDGRHLVTASYTGPVRVWELDTMTQVFRRTDGPSSALGVSLSADGRAALAAQQRAPILWSLVAEPTGDRDRQWTDLYADPVTAYRAQWGLAGSDGLARFLRAKIGARVPESDAERIKRLIAELDDSSFRTRETALVELVRLGRLAEPAVRTALAGSPSAEQRQRLEVMAARYKDGVPPDELRTRRAVQALRWCGDPEAKKLLADWASGMDGAPLTEAARAALGAMD
jgi:RNA polymerase sigma factor (sigma-70 family)